METSNVQGVSTGEVPIPVGRAGPARPEAPRRSGLGLASPHLWVGLTCFALLASGPVWIESLDLSPRNGLGYALGLVGLAAMTLLLGYSLRKRLRALRGAGPLRAWLEIHLVLGLIGPTAIAYHSHFELRSTNATVSMLAMAAVAGSGVGGRFLYGRLHRSLAGPRRTVASCLREARRALAPVADALASCPGARARMLGFVDRVERTPPTALLAFRALSTRPLAWREHRAARRALARTARAGTSTAPERAALEQGFALLCRGAELRLFEQLFALWHAVHVPLTVLLFLSAIVHVVAVHLY